MAKSFNQNSELLRFREACKRDSEWDRVLPMLCAERDRRKRGVSLIPDDEYKRECHYYWNDYHRLIDPEGEE
jgi:hypothetical protein